jgi:predicted ester cyclase
LYTPDWVGHFPQGLELRGPAAHKQFGRVFGAAFPDGRYAVEETLVAGDRVATHYTFRGTHRGRCAASRRPAGRSRCGG